MAGKMTKKQIEKLMSSFVVSPEESDCEYPEIDKENEAIISVSFDEMGKIKSSNLPEEVSDSIKTTWGKALHKNSQTDSADELFKYWEDFKKELQNETHWDKVAWYVPFHHNTDGWGIYIKQEAVITKAARIARYMPSNLPFSADLISSVMKLAWLSFFFHEYYHHNIESYATWVEQVAKTPIFGRYQSNVYVPTIKDQKTETQDKNLEEALANVNVLEEMRSKKLPFIESKVVNAARECIGDSFPYSPGGYRRAQDYLTKSSSFSIKQGLKKENTHILMTQILDGKLTPDTETSIIGGHPIKIGPIWSKEEIPCYTVIQKDSLTIFPFKNHSAQS